MIDAFPVVQRVAAWLPETLILITDPHANVATEVVRLSLASAVATTWTMYANSGAAAITVLPESMSRSRSARQLKRSAMPAPRSTTFVTRPLRGSRSCTTRATLR